MSRTEDGGGGADSDGDDVAYLMEHNAWLLEQLEAKDGSCSRVVGSRKKGVREGRASSFVAFLRRLNIDKESLARRSTGEEGGGANE